MVSAAYTRRAFVQGSAAGAIATRMATSTMRPALANEVEETGNSCGWLGSEPETPEEFKEEIEVDVVVVGLGWAGVSATRAACEAGASVAVFEKGSSFGLVSKNVNAYGSKLWLEHFPETEKYWNKGAVINAVMAGCLNRNSDAIQSRWLDKNGEVFDWFFAAMDGADMFYGTPENYRIPDDTVGMTETSYPYPANFDPANEYYPCFPGCARLAPSALPFFEANMSRAAEAAGDKLSVYRETPVIKLLKDNDRVVGVVAQDAAGDYYKAMAAKGVVLATGDFFENHAMAAALLTRPLPEDYMTLNSVFDVNGNPADVGDGHRMGIWAGARMQLDGCDMSHAIGGGTYVMGTLPALLLNKNGKRYMNEDVQGQQIAERIWEQKDCVAFQIFDAGFFDHMDDMPYGHGKHPEAKLETLIAEAEAGKLAMADTIEELLDQLDIDKDAALASIEHYNELCHGGLDEDFGKTERRMIPVETPPFFCDRYAGDGSSRGIGHLVTMSGLESDEDCHVYNKDMDIIPGLYACGNVQGNRFSIIYPEVLQGHSIAMAMTFGYIAGTNAAMGV